MQDLNAFIITSLVGLLSGLTYGLFFVAIQKRALGLEHPSALQLLAYSLFTGITRIGFLICAWFYMLHLTTAHSILVSFTFILMFLIVLFNSTIKQ